MNAPVASVAFVLMLAALPGTSFAKEAQPAKRPQPRTFEFELRRATALTSAGVYDAAGPSDSSVQ